MALGNHATVTLTTDDLNDIDHEILEYLRDEGRASPTLFKRAIGTEKSRQYVSSRFVRLAEHNHIKDKYDTGIYEFNTYPEDPTDD